MKRLSVVKKFLSWFAAPASADFAEGKTVCEHGDYATEFLKFKPLADQGDTIAQLILGIMYKDGKGVPQNFMEAARWYRLAADQGDATAQYNLGLLYHEGRGVPQDLSEAAKWYQKAADQGLVDALVLLASMYMIGLGVPSNQREAMYLLTKAAEQGDATAQCNLGLMYPWPSDSAIALKWLHKAAEQGYAKAYDHLGFYYHAGKGIPQNYVEAFKWYLLASLEGEEADSMMLERSVRDRMTGLKRQMTQEQIAEAKKLAREWKPKK